MMNKPYLPWSRWLKTSGYGTDNRWCNTSFTVFTLMSVVIMLCAGWLEPVGLFSSSLRKVNIISFFITYLWSAASRQLVIFWPPAFWLPEHHTWSSHPWWLPCVTTSRSCANNDQQYGSPLGWYVDLCSLVPSFSNEPVCPSCCRDDCISFKVGLFMNKLTLNDDKPLAVRPFWWLFGSTNWLNLVFI